MADIGGDTHLNEMLGRDSDPVHCPSEKVEASDSDSQEIPSLGHLGEQPADSIQGPTQSHRTQDTEDKAASLSEVSCYFLRKSRLDLTAYQSQPEAWTFPDPQYQPLEHRDQRGREVDHYDVLWQAVRKHHDDMCKAWKEDCIDTLLVFVSRLRPESDKRH
jgi:hypothetical protein